MAITEKTRKGLWGRSGNRCAICKNELVQDKDPFDKRLNLGEECHIISKQIGGPRHKSIPDFDYDDDENLLLLCCNDHKEIDTLIEQYPVDKLKSIKSDHEKWVKEKLDKNKREVDSAENVPKSRIEVLVDLVSEKYDIEMEIKSSKEILRSAKGVEIASKEVETIKIQIKSSIDKIKSKSPSLTIEIKENNHRIVNISFKGHTFLSQFYQAYSDSAKDSYLLFAILKGNFTSEGRGVLFDNPVLKNIIRLNFDCNEKGEFGWREQEGKKSFYKSIEITEEWIEKFFNYVLS